MKSFSFLSILTASLAPAFTDALKPSKCGGSLTSACLSETDKRYDADYPVSIVEQSPTWNQFEGLWKITSKNYEGDGTPALPTPYNAAIDQGVPYTRDDVVGFYNHSLIGSRMSINRYYVFNPAPEAFCNQTFEPPFQNVAGPGVCGVNGYAFTAGQYGTSTHDNNGDVSFFRVYGGYSGLPNRLPYDLNPPGRFSWIDTSTLWGTNSVEGFFSQSNPYIFLDNNTALVNTNFINLVERRRQTSAISEMVRMEESEWIAAIEQAYEDSNVIESQRIPVPFQEFTLDPASYPTEEEWCGGVGNDPACTVSQFQEPDAKLKTGPLLGFIILGLAVFCIPLYAFYRYRIEQQERRIKAQFIRGVAKNISISPSAGALSQENLIAEFARIDKDNGGTIEKAELKTWIDEGKLGNISDNDFNALWSALDLDGSGTVDFVEFCTFLSGCGEAFDEVYDQQEKMSKHEKMKYASSRLLKSAPGDDEKDIEKDIKD